MAKNTVFFLIFLFIFAACQYQTDNPQQSSGKANVEKANTEKDDYTLFELGRFEGLEKDTEWQILQAYLEKLQSSGSHADLTINDVWIEKYYGAYCPLFFVQEDKTWDEIYYGAENQTVIAVMMGNNDHSTEQQEVSMRHRQGRAFVRGGNSIFLWHDGQLDALEDHYNHSLLYLWDFLGIANLQNGLDSAQQLRIQEDFGDSLPRPWIQGYRNEIPVHYLGAYNGYSVLIAYVGNTPMVFHLEVGGVHFYTASGGGSGTRIFAWQEGQIYTLQELYEQDLITQDDLVTMAYNLHAPLEEIEFEEATTAGRLTITGLSAYEGVYITALASLLDDTMTLEGLKDATNAYDTKSDTSSSGVKYSGRISSGQADLKVFVKEPRSSGKGGGYQSYTGNDQNIAFRVMIGDRAPGYVIVNFTNGVGSGVFVPYP